MNNNPFDNYRGTSDSAVRNSRRELPMMWYKFLIYGVLWLFAAVNLLSSVSYLTGTAQTEEMLAQFPILGTIDRVYGILTIVLGVLMLITRFALAGYKKYAPLLIVGVYAFGFAISLGYNTVVLSITSSAYDPVDLILTEMSVSAMVIFNASMAICNYIYFKKRKRLFNK